MPQRCCWSTCAQRSSAHSPATGAPCRDPSRPMNKNWTPRRGSSNEEHHERRHARARHRGRRRVRLGPGARPGRRRPAQRRQVDAGQPHHRPPRGGRRGRARRDPRPGVLRRQLERPRLHRRRHRRLGPRRPRPGRADRGPGRDRGQRWPTPCCSSSTRPSASPTPTRPSSRSCARRGKPVVLAANKVDDQRAEAEAYGAVEPRAGRAVPGLRPARPRLAATCSTPSSPRCPSRRRELEAERRRPAPDRHRRQAQRRQVLAAQPAGRRGAGRRRQRRRHHRRPGRRAGRARRTHLALHRHRRHPQAGQGGLGPRVLRLAAHQRPRSTGPRSPCSSSTAASRISEQDLRIIQTIRESGRALVIAFNKWDLVDEERRYYLEREIERELVQVQWAPRINVTARTGWHVDRLVPALDKALEGWETRITTGALNAFLGRLVAEHPHPVRSGKQPKILFGTQAGDRAADVRAVHQRQAGRGATSASSSAACARSSASSARRSCCSSVRARSASAEPLSWRARARRCRRTRPRG